MQHASLISVVDTRWARPGALFAWAVIDLPRLAPEKKGMGRGRGGVHQWRPRTKILLHAIKLLCSEASPLQIEKGKTRYYI